MKVFIIMLSDPYRSNGIYDIYSIHDDLESMIQSARDLIESTVLGSHVDLMLGIIDGDDRYHYSFGLRDNYSKKRQLARFNEYISRHDWNTYTPGVNISIEKIREKYG